MGLRCAEVAGRGLEGAGVGREGVGLVGGTWLEEVEVVGGGGVMFVSIEILSFLVGVVGGVIEGVGRGLERGPFKRVSEEGGGGSEYGYEVVVVEDGGTFGRGGRERVGDEDRGGEEFRIGGDRAKGSLGRMDETERGEVLRVLWGVGAREEGRETEAAREGRDHLGVSEGRREEAGES